MLIYPNDSKLNFSKGTWLMQDTTATCYNAGANFNFTTDALVKGNKTITINIDLPYAVSGQEPVINYRINGIYYGYVRAISPIVITLPTGFANSTDDPLMNHCNSHYIEVWVKSISKTQRRWSSDTEHNVSVININSIELPDESTLFETKKYPITAISIGSSSSEGYGVTSETEPNLIDTDAGLSWGVLVGESLGLNVSTSGYGGTGFQVGGDGYAPNIFTYWEYLDKDVKRDWTGIDVALFNIGSNDSSLSSDDFISLNQKLITDIRKTRPDLIFIFTSPFQTGTRISEFAKLRSLYIDDAMVHFIDTNFSSVLNGHHTEIGQYKRLLLPTILPPIADIVYEGCDGADHNNNNNNVSNAETTFHFYTIDSNVR